MVGRSGSESTRPVPPSGAALDPPATNWDGEQPSPASPAAGEDRWGTHGSILLVVLLLVFGAAVLVAGLTLTSRAGLVSVEAEAGGREGLASADVALAGLARRAWSAWEPGAVPLSGGWDGELTEVPTEPTGLLSARVVPSGAGGPADSARSWGYSVDARVEMGHDGLDLPKAAAIAAKVVAAPERIQPVVLLESDAEGAATVCSGRGVDPALLGPGIVDVGLYQPWRLDAGTLAVALGEAGRQGSAVVTLTDRSTGWHRLPPGSPGEGPEDPILVVAAGGAGLDLRDRGDLFGVVVVDDAGLRLEGTILHGAVVVSEDLDVGTGGQVLWSSSLYRWATDRSVRRVRLIPGSRAESLFP